MHRYLAPAVIFVCASTLVGLSVRALYLSSTAPARLAETDSSWVPRVPGSKNTPVISGQCGQFDGLIWHRIECPEVK